MPLPEAEPDILEALDEQTRELVELAVAIAIAREPQLRDAMARAVRAGINHVWVEELILQSYLFSGFPRALNAAREWRRASGRPAPAHDEGHDTRTGALWRERGEDTCRAVYGGTYERLRRNIRELHPALDDWMIVDGYGKVLGRPSLDLPRRELCIVAVCAVLEQDRQLHAHLHGALNVGASAEQVSDTLRIASRYVSAEARDRYAHLWARVRP
jgi:4-carboxymuconolactone decarboxylase